MSNASIERTCAAPGQREQVPVWAQWLYDKTEWLLTEFGGGPRSLRIDHAVNVQKFVTIGYIYLLMVYFDNFSPAAWVYLGLHGIYGYTWLIKDLAFPNSTLSKRTTIPGLLAFYALLGPSYWALPWLFMSRHIDPAGPVLFVAVAMHTLGVAWMLAGDLQKNCTVSLRKGLIDNGVFKYTRNPNYLGEIMIYWSYALLVAHWLGWLVVVTQLFLLFLPRMLVKDASISRHPGWAEYKARSGLVIPWRIVSLRAVFDK